MDSHFILKCMGILFIIVKKKKYDLTIFSNLHNDNNFLNFYKNIDLFFDYHFEIRNSTEFYDMFDVCFLITDDDPTFDKSNLVLNQKVICIEHFYLDRCPSICNKIATRPFDSNYYRDWALPCYPIIDKSNKKHVSIDNKDTIYIVIVGGAFSKYNTEIMNRIKYNDKKISFIVIGRDVSANRFEGINNDIDINVYQNIDTIDMMNNLCGCNFLLADYNRDTDYEDKQMTGSIPLAFSLLVPLIISKQTNRFYQFENVIEFDKDSGETIFLKNIEIDSLEKQREHIIKQNFGMFDKHIEMIE